MNLISAGIDIGTTTTRVAISRFTIADTAGAFRLPQMRIVQKELLYLGDAQFTPRDDSSVDGAALGALIQSEYARAGHGPADIDTGAVILTGEAARCRNAPQVAHTLARLAGGFVVASAGADMEGVLAARGSGAAALCAGGWVLHTDIGGGTANICLLHDGEPVDTGCLDIGGRLIRYAPGTRRIDYISPSIGRLELGIAQGEVLSDAGEARVAGVLADILAEALYLKAQSPRYRLLLADHGISKPPAGCPLTFSGGVADMIYEPGERQYDDIGGALARAIAAHPLISLPLRPAQVGAATVMGAADFTLSLSGSTVHWDHWQLPVAGLQAVSVRLRSREDISGLPAALRRAAKRYTPGCALAMEGLADPSFQDVEAVAEALADALCGDLIVILKKDMAKALGQALCRRTDRRILCLDGLPAQEGDYIDIGQPVGGVFPVIIHTLLFGR